MTRHRGPLDRRLTLLAYMARRLSLRLGWPARLMAIALALVVLTSIVTLVPGRFGVPVAAAMLATVPALACMPVKAENAQIGWPTARLWLATFVLTVVAVELPPIIADYLAMRRTELCLHVAGVWLQGEHASATRHAVRCSSPVRAR